MTRSFFITGTGTDVGKTVVTRGVVRALVQMGLKVTALKPVESGVPIVDGKPMPHDAMALLSASNSHRTLSETCLYMFKPAVSPHLAARMENRTIDEKALISFISNACSECDVLIAEGAGGLLVPLNDHILYADVIAATEFELIIVTPDILGAINATLLTIEAARARHIPVAGVIMNQGPQYSWDNEAAISTFGKVPMLGMFPAVASLDDETLAAAASSRLHLSRWIQQNAEES